MKKMLIELAKEKKYAFDREVIKRYCSEYLRIKNSQKKEKSEKKQ